MRFGLVAALAGVVCVTQAVPATAQKPGKQATSQITEIAGKTLDQWIEEIPSKDRSKGENAIRTVLLFGPELAQRALPALLGELKKHSSSYPIDTSIRVNATIAVGQILGGADDPDARLVAEAVGILRRLVQDPQALVKYRAAQALGRIGPAAHDAIPELLAAVKDINTWETRQAAAIALGRVAVDKKAGANPLVLQTLYTIVKADSASQVRLAAVQALAWLGPPAGLANAQAMEKAIEYVALQDPEKTVQIWAHLAFMNVKGKIDPPRVAYIGKLLADSKELGVRIQAAQALGTVGPEARGQIPRLVQALDDPDNMVVGWSAWALSHMGRAATEAVPRLQQLAKDMERPEAIRQMATDAIAAIENKGKAN